MPVLFRCAIQSIMAWLLLLAATSMANADEYKTYCIGRLLIDIPASFELVRHSGSAYISELERIGTGGPEEAEKLWRERVGALRNNSFQVRETNQIYLKSQTIDRFYFVSRQGDFSALGLGLRELWFEDMFFSSQGIVFRATHSMKSENEVERREQLIRVAKATTPREPDEIPNKEGSCVDGAFIALPPEGETQGALFMPIHEQPIAIEFTFSLRKPGGRQLGLEGAQGSLGRRISIAGLNGRYAKDYADKGFMFYAAVGQQTTENQFGLSLRIKYFDTRSDFGKAPYTRQKADEIWDRLVNSARIRP